MSFKVFGCLAFASTLPSKRHRFSARATPSIFVGYPNGYNGYNYTNYTTGPVLEMYFFHETSFPFHSV